METKTIMKMNFFLAAPGSAWQRSAALFTWSLFGLSFGILPFEIEVINIYQVDIHSMQLRIQRVQWIESFLHLETTSNQSYFWRKDVRRRWNWWENLEISLLLNEDFFSIASMMHINIIIFTQPCTFTKVVGRVFAIIISDILVRFCYY